MSEHAPRSAYDIVDDAIRETVAASESIGVDDRLVTGWLVIVEIAHPSGANGHVSLATMSSMMSTPWSRIGWLDDAIVRERQLIAARRFADRLPSPPPEPEPNPEPDDAG